MFSGFPHAGTGARPRDDSMTSVVPGIWKIENICFCHVGEELNLIHLRDATYKLTSGAIQRIN